MLTAILGILGKFILPAVTPALTAGLSGLFGRVFGSKGAVPQTFEQAVAWEKLTVEKLTAIAALDAPAGNISPWVANLRASNRYILADLIIVGGVIVIFATAAPESVKLQALDMIEVVFSFFFGERMYLGINRRGK